MQKIKTIDSLFYCELGKKLRQAREYRKITLKELSKKTGYSRSLHDHWELGFNKIRPEQLERTCKALQIPNDLTIDVGLKIL